MNDITPYTIRLRGQVLESEINLLSPIQVMATQPEPDLTRLTFTTDQAGLIGLLRHLHGMGFVFLSISRIEQSKGMEECQT